MSSAERVAERLGLDRESLTGKVAVVTGGGQGIGREIARVFARLGAKAIIADIAKEGAWTQRVVRDSGGKALFVRTDVSDEAGVLALAQETREVFGPADILINNAILCPVSPVLDMDAASWDRVMGVNLRGAFLACKAFLPDMLAKGQGVIVNMVSTDAMPYLSAYIASKQGLVGFTQSLAAEVGENGVRVIAFRPGFVDTPGLRQAGKQLA
ncbi:MAG: SDR family NAD(P)-dependent oxidoreductase, partial [Bacillota bacterium]